MSAASDDPGMPSTIGTVICAMAILLAGPASASAAVAGNPISGTITVTGTGGKDELRIELDGNALRFVVEPAAAVTATSGTCPPNTDPLTGRPTFNECPIAGNTTQRDLVVNLGSGDDTVIVDDGAAASSITVNGGAGNDLVRVSSRAVRTLKGDDGNDTLLAAGQVGVSGSNASAAFDGGTGSDTAAWDAVRVGGSTTDQTVGVTASLATNTATVAGLNNSQQPVTFRTDTLTAIENLSGTQVGDVLTGNAAANVLTGSDGNDNLNGGDGNDNLQGGNGLDNLVSGKGSDAIDGGLGIDVFPPDSGLDTYNVRDGFQEDVTCVNRDVIVNDLVDKVLNNTAATACSVSTAAAKHLFDTKLSGRPAKIVNGALETRVRCPVEKFEPCEGRIQALLGKRELGHADYKLRPGQATRVRLPLAKTAQRLAEGKRIVLSAAEIDADGRDRFVSRPTRVEKLRPGT